MNENTMMATVRDEQNALLGFDDDYIYAVAETADRKVTAINKIMEAVVKMAKAQDWVLIGGVPYLMEGGASNIASGFVISVKTHDGYPKIEYGPGGYPSVTYRMTFSFHGRTVDVDGGRNSADEFFAGKGRKKTADEIDILDVTKAAYTNCMNRGIKEILPGLRNLELKDLEHAGLDVSKIKGYTFKDGGRGGNSGRAEDSGIVCEACGKPITQKVASYSQGKYGRKLCMDCQKSSGSGATDAQYTDVGRPPFDDMDAPPPYGERA